MTESDTKPRNKYFEEYNDKIQKEMQVFTGKMAADKGEGETASTMSASKKSVVQAGARAADLQAQAQA